MYAEYKEEREIWKGPEQHKKKKTQTNKKRVVGGREEPGKNKSISCILTSETQKLYENMQTHCSSCF